MVKRVLFICKYNRFRSKIAEIFFKRYNRNKLYEAKSAGIIKGRYPLDEREVGAAREMGINLKGRPQGLSSDLLIWQDIVIVVADDVPVELFKRNKKHGKKLIIWKVPDFKHGKKQEIKRIINLIEGNVIKFLNKVK